MATNSSHQVGHFYDTVADSYDAQMAQSPSQDLLRRAFWELVESRIPHGSLVLDFGCGTGIDAAHYAAVGYRVIAYDVSRGMLDILGRRCATEIAQGTIVPVIGPWEQLQEVLKQTDPVVACVANFAVLNLISDLDSLFRHVKSHMAEVGYFVLSVQNPFYFRDMGAKWWWQGLWAGWAKHAVIFRGGAVPTYRYRIPRLIRAAGPSFILTEQWSVLGGKLRRSSPLNRLGHMRLLVLESGQP